MRCVLGSFFESKRHRFCGKATLVPDKLFEHIEKKSDEYVQELKTVCTYESISAYKESHKQKIADCSQMLTRIMDDLGFETRVSSINGGNPIILGELKSSRSHAKTLMFYNHYDVQPAEPVSEWISEPFSLAEREGRLYARGVSDNKGPLVARLAAVKAVLDVFGETPTNLIFIIEGEEEIGSPSLEPFVKANKEQLRADGCLWEGSERDASGRIVVKLGYKGMLYVELSAKGPKTDQHSKWAPILANPAWRLCWALASMKNRDERVLIDNFYDEINEPTEGDLAELRETAFDVASLKKSFGVNRLLAEDNAQDFVKQLFFMPTLNIAGFHAGYSGPASKTILPHQATAKVDIRLVPDQDPSKMLELLKRHLAKHGFNDIELKSVNQMDCARSSIESEIVKTVMKSAREVYEKDPIIYPIANGSSPMSTIINLLGIPSAGVSGTSRNDSNVHGPNENIRREDFIDGIKLMTRIISRF